MNDNNQANTLLQLRNKIDQIDEQIINLLNQRMGVITEVAAYKKSINDKFFIKSAREADMIKALIKKADGSIPKSTIVNIWRKIITSSNNLEQPLKIAIHNPNQIKDYQYLIREYYSDFVPLSFHDSINNVVLEIEKSEAQIGIFALPDNSQQQGQQKSDHWWINLANNKSGIKIFAKIPFIGQSEHQLVAVAIKEPEKSDDDQTLLSVEVDKEFSRYQLEDALKAQGLKFKILQSVKLEQIHNINFYLIELNGFFVENDAPIKQFSSSEVKPFVKVLGHFANPI